MIFMALIYAAMKRDKRSEQKEEHCEIYTESY